MAVFVLLGRWWRTAGAVLVAALCLAAPASGSALPDGRGYELVSPPAKNGADVMAASSRVRASADGNAVGFPSLGGFGDPQGSGVAFDYVGSRTGAAGTNGWVTHAIDPREQAGTLLGAIFGFDSLYVGEFSSDLSCGVYSALRPLPDVGSPADIPSLYLRDDLLSSGAGSYQLLMVPLVPVTSTVIPPNAAFAGMSSDCRHAIFESPRALVPEAVGHGRELYDWADGAIRLAGVLPDGTAAPNSIAGLGAVGHYTPGMISPDGRRVFFSVPATGNVYMRVDGSSTVQLNASEKTVPESPQPASLWAVSADGTRAFFTTSEGLVNGDDDGNPDVYMFDASAPAGQQLTLVSATASEPEGATAYASGVAGVSADGRYVYFFSLGQLVAGEPLLGADNGLYVWHDGDVRFIGRMADPGAVVPNGPSTPFGFDPMTARVTPDGRHLLFMTSSDAGFRGRGGFAGYDHGTCSSGHGCRELYVYSADTGALACASCNPTGATATANAAVAVRQGTSAANVTTHLPHAFSDDGRRVFFSTSEALVPEDVNGQSDAYEYDVPSGRVSLLSSGTESSGSYFMDASPSGDDAFFVTRQRLVGWDTDQNYDLYDARVGGGLPEPVTLPPGCSGEACQGQLSGAPSPAATGSDVYAGAGDARAVLKRRHAKAAPKRCVRRRHGRRVRVRCATRRRARHAARAGRSVK